MGNMNNPNNTMIHEFTLNKGQRFLAKKQKGFVLWLTGLSGSGKSSIADVVETKLFARQKCTYLVHPEQPDFNPPLRNFSGNLGTGL
jgi:adenylylsulfate kinase